MALARRAASLILILLAAAAAAPTLTNAQIAIEADVAGSLHMARPRGAILTLLDSGAEAFLGGFESSELRPLPVAVGQRLRLHADYEALFMPLTAGHARFEIEVHRLADGGRLPLDSDDVEVVAFGPARRAGRLALSARLDPGLHRLELVATARTRAVGVAEWTEDRDTAELWILVGSAEAALPGPIDGRGHTIAGGQPLPDRSRATLDRAHEVDGIDQIDGTDEIDGTDHLDGTDQLPVVAKALGGLSVGAQRGALADGALGAQNFEIDGGMTIRTAVGAIVPIWSDYELWWTEGAWGVATAELRIRHAAADAALVAPLAEGRFHVGDGVGPRLEDGTLVAALSLDRPGTFHLAAQLTTVIERGGTEIRDVDVVPFTLEVLAVPPATGAVAGRVVAGATDPGLDAAGSLAGEPIEGVTMIAYTTGGHAAGRARTNADGEYRIEALDPGDYLIRAAPAPLNFLDRWWRDSAGRDGATPVTVAAGRTSDGIVFRLVPGATIAGRVTDGAGRPVAGIEISTGPMRADGGAVPPAHPGGRSVDDLDPAPGRARTNDDGTYSIDRLPAGIFWVRARDPEGRYLTEYFDDAVSLEDAEPVGVEAGNAVEDIDFILGPVERAAVMAVDPAHASASMSTPGRLAIVVREVADLGAFEAAVSWDPAILEVDAVAIGAFLGSTGRDVVPVTPVIDNAAGRLTFAAASVGDAPGPSGAGDLFEVEYTPKATGETRIRLSETILTGPRGRDIAHGREHGSVRVGGCMFADFDCNCRIDIRDVMAVVVRWGMSEGDPDWDPRFDLNADATISIIDVQIVAGLWGTVCPVDGVEGVDGAGGAWAREARPIKAVARAGRLEADLALSADVAALAVGERVTIALDVSGAVDVAAFEVSLAFDPARLAFVGAELGDFLGRTGRTVTQLGPDVSDGAVTLAAYSMPSAPAPSGDGRLALIIFEAIGEGPARVELAGGALVDSSNTATDVTGESVALDVGEARTEVEVFVPYAVRRR